MHLDREILITYIQTVDLSTRPYDPNILTFQSVSFLLFPIRGSIFMIIGILSASL